MGTGRTDEFRKDAVRIALTSGLTRRQVVTCPPKLPHSYREFAGLDFIFFVVSLGKRVGRGALKLLKRSTRVSRCFIPKR